MNLTLEQAHYLVRMFGTPLFVVHEDQVRQNVRNFLQDMQIPGYKVQCAYSYKTNPVLGLCLIMHQEGCMAEVVSSAEYKAALHLDVPSASIVLNGPCKGDCLPQALLGGALINVDSYDELGEIEDICARHGKKAGIGIRVNAKLGQYPWSKFGFSLESGQALDACRRVHNSRMLSLRGLHIHAGTNITDLGILQAAVEGLARLLKDVPLSADLGTPYLDLGGGFAVEAAPPLDVHPDEWKVPPIAEYGHVLRKGLDAAQCAQELQVILEPGRILVATAVSLLATVKSVKSIANRPALIIDAGVNVLPSAYYLKHPVRSLKSVAAQETYDIYGPLCTQYDLIGMSAPLSKTDKGDLLEIGCAGAYTISFSSQFMYPRPAVVLLRKGTPLLIRRREGWKDMYGKDVIPRDLLLWKREGFTLADAWQMAYRYMWRRH